jgi:uncharacterized membrane protein
MMMHPARAASLVAAMLCVGLMAGVFVVYATTIMPGLGHTDDRTFVGAFQSIDRAIEDSNWVAVFIFGAFGFTILAGALHLGRDHRSALLWIVAALVLYTTAMVITGTVNVPLNDDIKAAGHPDRIADLAAVREHFNEARWVRWNQIRAVANTAAFGCLAWALVLFGRST